LEKGALILKEMEKMEAGGLRGPSSIGGKSPWK